MLRFAHKTVTQPTSRPLPRDFFARPTLTVARELLGARLVHREVGVRISGTILETEAYIGEEDNACHARAGRTTRTSVMYGPPGHAYVYFNYGIHWLFNIVTEREGFPAAVLVRAIVPEEGIDRIAARRGGRPPRDWANGPAKLCQALGITGDHNGTDLCGPGSALFVEAGPPVSEKTVSTTPRVGLNKVEEPWKSIPWRFVTRGFSKNNLRSKGPDRPHPHGRLSRQGAAIERRSGGTDEITRG